MIGITITKWMSQAFTTIGRPIWTVLLNVIGTAGIVIPLAILGKAIYGYIGILLGVVVGQLIVGLAFVILAKSKMYPDSV